MGGFFEGDRNGMDPVAGITKGVLSEVDRIGMTSRGKGMIQDGGQVSNPARKILIGTLNRVELADLYRRDTTGISPLRKTKNHP